MAGATTASGAVFCSVWHPEIVALRQSLGLPRHPAQVVLSRDGNLDLDRPLMFNVPEVPVYILGGSRCCERLAAVSRQRPWISVIRMEDGNLASAFRDLRLRGLGRISMIGGRSAASALIDAGVVQDLCLTTTGLAGGEPHTPFYAGSKALVLSSIASKRSASEDSPPIQVEQLTVSIG
jgi:riboflavin biosynthesis pyrimidine reductase